ncbi:MAG: asparagine synthase [Caulobacteraceae bacterium]|nr:asparagine synthase [Caulobacteraceae bacterium]
MYRDPSGGIDALVWRHGPLTLVSSDFSRLPRAFWPQGLRLDWAAVGRFMGAASAATSELGLEGVLDVAPGAHRGLARLDATTLIWSPAAFAASCDQRADADLADELRGRLDMVIGALMGGRRRAAVEVSGGLDSAIVAGSLGRLGLTDQIALWLNYVSDRPEGDEQAYARAVTAAIDVELTAVRLTVCPLVEADFAEVARAPRPPMNALVPRLDRDVAAQLARHEATALLSGQGGDAVFYQMPTVLGLADELRRRGPIALLDPMVAHVASMLRRSVWRVAADAIGAHDPPAEHRRPIAAVPKSLAQARHPWIRASARSAPAKRLQVIGLANAHVATGDRRLTRSADLLYPLFAQPIVEFCLQVPVAALQRRGRERALARRTFADRLPAIIVERRKKGELTAFHARTVAASLDFLRPHLLDGYLVAAGVIDRGRLEEALRHNHLLRHAGGGEILVAAALESWVRHWRS